MAIKWEEPKIDWKSTDRFNFSDYNRIKNNISYIYRKATELNKPFDIEDMGEDLVVDSDEDKAWQVEVFNAFENNLHTISNKIINADIGHVSPQMPIINGGKIEVESKNGKGTLRSYLD